jgi:uncharacterized protein YggE
MKKSMLSLVLGLAVALPGVAQVGAPRDPAAGYRETLSVNGTGRSNVVPDRVAFTVGVQTVADSVEAAISQNNERVAKAIAALKSAGAQDKEIQTSRFSIIPQQDHRQGALPRIIGYQVGNSITVRTDRIAEAGRLLQAAVKAGVNTASGIRFEVADPAKGRDEALRAAFVDARAQASVLAQAAGRTLGRALNISEGGASGPPPVPYARAMAMSAEGVTDVPVSAGTQELVYTVTVVFELR